MERVKTIEKLLARLRIIKRYEEDEWSRIQQEATMIARKLFSKENYSKQIAALKIHYYSSFSGGGSERFRYWDKSLKELEIILETMKKEVELESSLNMEKVVETIKPQESPELMSSNIENIQKEMVQLLYNLIFADPNEFKEETHKVPPHIKRAVIKRDNQVCQICQKRLKPEEINIDHIYPYALGGGNNFINLMVLCEECNQDKGKRKEYFQSDVGREKILENIKKFVEKLPPIDNFLDWIKQIAKSKIVDIEEGATGATTKRPNKKSLKKPKQKSKG